MLPSKIEREYDYGQALDIAERLKVQPWHSSRREDGDSDDPWHGTNTWEEAISYAREGWPDGLSRISKALALIPTKPAPLRRMRADIAGWYADIPRAIADDPFSMLDRADALSSKAVKIIVQNAFNCGMDAEQLAARGAAIAATVDTLESHGIRCEIDVIASTHGSNGGHGLDLTTRVHVKERPTRSTWTG